MHLQSDFNAQSTSPTSILENRISDGKEAVDFTNIVSWEFNEAESENLEDPTACYEFDEYLEYDDFSASERINRKQPIQRNHRQVKHEGAPVKLKSKVLPHPSVYQSTRKNINSDKKVHFVDPKRLEARRVRIQAEYEESVQAFLRDRKLREQSRCDDGKHYRICEHSPHTYTVCRICETESIEQLEESTALTKTRKPSINPSSIDAPCDCKGNCQLTGPKCCSCMDRRPLNLNYWAYQDGAGYTKTVRRNRFYCPACNGLGASNPPQGSKVPSIAFSVPLENTHLSLTEVSDRRDNDPNAEYESEAQEFDEVQSLRTVTTCATSWTNLSDDLKSVTVSADPNQSIPSYQKVCGHNCYFRLTLKRCGCADERPVEDTYWVYLVDDYSKIDDDVLDDVDDFQDFTEGVLIETSKRNQLYCESCKQFSYLD